MSEHKLESFDHLREKLDTSSGRRYWKSMEDLSASKDFQDAVDNEFPQEPTLWDRKTTRRSFLQLMGSMIAMAGLAGCTRQPEEKIVPYVKQPEDIVPGKPLFYASAINLGGSVRGILVESHMGRPTKVEGNPAHPDSTGAADAITQASVLDLYDPDRSRQVLKKGSDNTWSQFINEAGRRLKAAQSNGGEGVRILTPEVVSPTLYHQLRLLEKKFPKLGWHQYAPDSRTNIYEGSQLAFGEIVVPRFDIKKADVILALDSDFINDGPGAMAYAQAWAKRRKVRKGKEDLNRMYAVESTPTLTGAAADHRLPLRAVDIEGFLVEIANLLGAKVNGQTKSWSDKEKKWIHAVAKDLMAHKGKSLVVAGDAQSPTVHALTHIINAMLGNAGKTVLYARGAVVRPENNLGSIKTLTDDLNANKVTDLFVVDANPIFTAPADLEFEKAIQKTEFSAHLGLYNDETAKKMLWHIPAAHSFESWSDGFAFDGTASVIQPLIQPLYGGKSAHQLISVMLGDGETSDYDTVRNFWKTQFQGVDFERFWKTALHDGVFKGTGFSPKQVTLSPNIRLGFRTFKADAIEINYRKDPHVGGSGERVNNGWLQELPKPLSRLTWDNAVLLSPRMAEKHGLRNEDIVKVELEGRSIEGPAWVLPGHADESITLHYGYGRSESGKVGNDTGFNVFPLRTTSAADTALGATLTKTGKKSKLACTQDHHSMENRHLVREADVETYKQHPDFAQHVTHEPTASETLYKPEEHLKGDYQWAMSIDLNTCIGCNACTIACQSENNIAIVGKEEVLNGRELHWIRVDRYYEGDLDNPKAVHQPMACQHCENAPCEPVCPVGATVHSDEGLNDMVYNRCVGTRYCSNNCPYKVRRFNFYQYSDMKTASLKNLRNPDVTVRTRGVMEKCTYCVQRINSARIESKKENRTIRDGEIVTACQQTCPTQAIVFGDIKDKTTEISKVRGDDLSYGVLTELGTRPRTTYVARVTNPNPEIEKLEAKKTVDAHHG